MGGNQLVGSIRGFFNLCYLDWVLEKRQQNLPLIAKRLTERGKEYKEVEEEVLTVQQTNISVT